MGVWGLGFRGLGFRVQEVLGLLFGFRVLDLGVRVKGVGFWPFGFEVWGFGVEGSKLGPRLENSQKYSTPLWTLKWHSFRVLRACGVDFSAPPNHRITEASSEPHRYLLGPLG